MARHVRRPLALFAAGFLCALFLTLSLSLPACFPVAAAAAGAFLFALFRAKKRERFYPAAVLLLGLLSGILFQGGYRLAFVEPARKLAGGEGEVSLLVTEKKNYGFSAFGEVGGRKARVFLRLYDDGEYRPGDRLSFYGKFSLPAGRQGFDAEKYYLSDGIPLTVTPAGEIAAEKEAFPPLAALYSLRTALLSRVTRLFGGHAGEMAALLWGERSSLPEETRLALSRTGLSHAFVVSGMHLSFVISLFALLRARRSYLFAAIPAALFFALLTGFGVSVLRAFLMLLYAALGSALRRPRDPLTSLLSTLLLILLYNPFALYDAALVYSYLSVAGIFFLSPRLSEFLSLPASFLPRGILSRIFRTLSGTAAVSASAGIAVLPASLFYTGRLALYFLPSNLVLLWLVPVLFLGGLASTLVSYLFFPLGALLGDAIGFLLSLFLGVDRLFASLPHAVIGAGHPLFALFAFLGLALLFFLSLRERRILRPRVFALLLLPFLLLGLFLRLSPAPDATVTCLAGRNDCVLLLLKGNSFLFGFDETAMDLLERENIASPDYLIPGPGGEEALARFPDAKNLAGENLLMTAGELSLRITPDGNAALYGREETLRILFSPAIRRKAGLVILGKAAARDPDALSFLPDAPLVLLGQPPRALPSSLRIEAEPFLEGEVTVRVTGGHFTVE